MIVFPLLTAFLFPGVNNGFSFCACFFILHECFYYLVLLSYSLASLPVQSPLNTFKPTQFCFFWGDLFPLVLCLPAHTWGAGCYESQAHGCHPGTPLAGALCLSFLFIYASGVLVSRSLLPYSLWQVESRWWERKDRSHLLEEFFRDERNINCEPKKTQKELAHRETVVPQDTQMICGERSWRSRKAELALDWEKSSHSHQQGEIKDRLCFWEFGRLAYLGQPSCWKQLEMLDNIGDTF